MSYPLFHPQSSAPLPMMLEEAAFAAEFPGEDEHLELKQGVSVARIQAAAVAFSNADGGVIVTGVSPGGTPLGLVNPGEKAKDIHQAFRGLQNPGRYEIHELHVEGRVLLVVSVERRREGFAQTPAGVVLMRRGASNVPLVGSELSQFLARRSFATFEVVPTGTSLADVDPTLRARLCAAYGWRDDEQLHDRLEEAGFVTSERGGPFLTVAGALLLLPDPQAIGGRPYVDVRRYAEGEPDADRVWQMRGPADHQIEQATRQLRDELGTTSVIVGARRVELPRLPERALREAVANAVAHRSYEHTGTAIRIELHPTHVTITSPGSLPEPVTIENIRYQQAARNDRLLGALRRLHLAEDQGLGIDRIEDDMAADLLRAPEFATDGSFFSITLRLGALVTPRERAWVRMLVADGDLDPRSALVVVTTARQGRITNGDVRSVLDVDSVVARAVLRGLVRAGVLVQHGERGGAEYRLAPSVGIMTGIRPTDTELDEATLALAAEGAVSNTTLRDRTGLDRVQARAVLKRLVDQGKLVQTGSRRGTRYELPTS